MSLWASIFGRREPPPPPDAPLGPPPRPTPEQFIAGPGPHPAQPPVTQPPPPAPSPAELDAALTDLIRMVNRAGRRMPEGAVPAVREVEDVLRPLLRYLHAHSATEAEMVGVRATVLDYLPTTVRTFLMLPPDFAATHRNRLGRTPAEEFLEQLGLLVAAARESATAIYAGDAQELTNQGRFLQSKFARSPLDLS